MAKVYVFLADGFEDVEALIPIDVLRRGGVDVITVSTTEFPLVESAHGVNIEADIQFEQSDYKDASAAAIIACGLLKMWNLDGCDPADPALAMAERILRTLASPEYLAEPRTNGGFLLKHSVGNLPGGTEIDVPLTYADYYFLEALTLLPH